MTDNQRELLALKDMTSYALKATDFIRGMTFQSFSNDEKTQFAVTRALEIVGEAATRVTPSTRTLAPEKPWRQIIVMRNRLIHHYFGVDHKIVGESASSDTSVLASQISELMKLQESTHSGDEA